jgi:hypothetical protein
MKMAIAPGGKSGVELNIILSPGKFPGLFFEKYSAASQHRTGKLDHDSSAMDPRQPRHQQRCRQISQDL